MSKHSPKFVSNGLQRLLSNSEYREKQAAVEAKIREKYAAELSAATNYAQRVAVKKKIQHEIKQSRPSACCLWSSK